MNASIASRAWAWRSFLWAGVVASVLTWAWVWFRGSGPVIVMVFFAIASVLLAYRGTAGVRVALAGLILTGFTMFLASIYWTYMLLLQGNRSVNGIDVVTLGVFPMVAAVLVLLGSVAGFRRVRAAQPAAQTAQTAQTVQTTP